MKRFNKVIACALSILMVANPLSVHANDDFTWKDDNKLITSSIESECDIVTVKLDIAKKSGITSGQGIVYYDKDELDLQWTTSVGYWDMYDINENYVSEDGRTGVSYAFATYEAPKKTGTMLTICFKAKNATNGKVINAESNIVEIYADSESLLCGVDKEELQNTLEVEETPFAPVISTIVNIRKRIGSIFKGIFG